VEVYKGLEKDFGMLENKLKTRHLYFETGINKICYGAFITDPKLLLPA